MKKRICLIDVVLGLAMMSQEKVTAAVDSLVKNGALGKEQTKDFLSTVQTKGAACKKTLGGQFQDIARKVLAELGFVPSDKVAKLRKEIYKLKSMRKPTPVS